jgi:hypothetical protein
MVTISSASHVSGFGSARNPEGVPLGMSGGLGTLRTGERASCGRPIVARAEE